MSTEEDDGFTRITLRIPKELHAKLVDAAAKKRSTNAEIIARLEATFEGGADFTKPDLTIVLDASGVPVDMAMISEHLSGIRQLLGVPKEKFNVRMQVNAKGLLFQDPTGERAERFLALQANEKRQKP